MSKIMRLLLFAVISLATTGCLHLVEEMNIQQDGSGSYTYRMELKDETGSDLYSNMYDSFYVALVNKYKQLNGVSNVVYEKSAPNIYAVKLDFKDVNALNAVVNIDSTTVSEKNLFSWSKGVFSRNEGGLPMIDALLSDDDNKDLFKMYLKDLHYSLLIHLPGKVKSMTNHQALLSDKDRTVSANYSMQDLLDKAKLLTNQIKYKY
jgi:hypothetical protein